MSVIPSFTPEDMKKKLKEIRKMHLKCSEIKRKIREEEVMYKQMKNKLDDLLGYDFVDLMVRFPDVPKKKMELLNSDLIQEMAKELFDHVFISNALHIVAKERNCYIKKIHY